MKQTILALALTMAAGGAFASGGLSIDTVKDTNIKVSDTIVDRAALAHGPVDKFESYKGQMVVVDSEALRHGSDA